MGTIKNLKEVYVRKEATFAEVYDHTAAGFKQIKVADFTLTLDTVKMETKYLNLRKEQGMLTSTGLVNGKMTFSKPLDASIYQYTDLVKAGFGKFEQSYNAPGGIVQSLTGNTVTLDDAADVVVGSYVVFGVPASNFYTSVNEVTDVTGPTITLKYDLTADEQVQIETGVDEVILPPVISPAELENYSFTIACVYSDDSVRVLRGAKVGINYDSAREGKQEVKFDIMSAAVASADAGGTAYVKPSGTITYEGVYDSVYLNFDQKWVYDPATEDKTSVCPYGFDVKIAHPVIKEKGVCGVNGVVGYYTSSTLTAELEVSNNSENEELFSPLNGVNPENFLFLSQGNLAFIADEIRFTNPDYGYTDDFDHIKLNADINHSRTEDFLIALPH